ncbi:MAG: acyl-CoA/acyl-ACP dehydrogenase [Proteobacteria bacterium]|nr:acyl-CoA/acyl-ACP dehydrogenase [Pseudomonadota bacterium]
MTQSAQASTLAAIPEVLKGIDALFRRALRHTHAEVTSAADVNQALDHCQVQGYEFAMINAELHAANAIIDYARSCMTERDGDEHGAAFESHLAGAFVAEILLKLRARFEKIRHLTGLNGREVHEAFETAEAERFNATHLQPAFLEATAAQILEHGSHGRSLLDEDKQIIASSFARIADDIVAPQAEHIHRDDLNIPEDILAALVEMGCFALSIPEAYGGTAPASGHDNLAMCVVTEELSRASLAAAGSPLTRPEILSRAIMAGGDEAQKQQWLPGIAAGNPIVAIAVTEPDCGSDVAAVRLRATPTAGGFLLNGAKTWCTFAGKAGLLMVLARTDADPAAGHRGLSLFLLEKPQTDDKAFEFRQPSGGVLSGKAIPTIGYRGMHSYTLFFDNVFVPEANIIGGKAGLNRGFYHTMAGFAGGRLQTAARACGVMRAAFESAIRYAKDRRVFGQPLADYQLTRAKLVSMAANLRACQEMTYDVARLMDQGRGHMEASLVKLYACRAAESITREAMQIHGGMGYSEETAVSRYFVDARVLSIFEGAEETLALKVVARELILKGE